MRNTGILHYILINAEQSDKSINLNKICGFWGILISSLFEKVLKIKLSTEELKNINTNIINIISAIKIYGNKNLISRNLLNQIQ